MSTPHTTASTTGPRRTGRGRDFPGSAARPAGPAGRAFVVRGRLAEADGAPGQRGRRDGRRSRAGGISENGLNLRRKGLVMKGLEGVAASAEDDPHAVGMNLHSVEMTEIGLGMTPRGVEMAETGLGIALHGAGMAENGWGMGKTGPGMAEIGLEMNPHGVGTAEIGGEMGEIGVGMVGRGVEMAEKVLGMGLRGVEMWGMREGEMGRGLAKSRRIECHRDGLARNAAPPACRTAVRPACPGGLVRRSGGLVWWGRPEALRYGRPEALRYARFKS